MLRFASCAHASTPGIGQGAAQAIEDAVALAAVRIDDVVEKIRGKKGTKVRLDILPAEAGVDAKPELVVSSYNALVATPSGISLAPEGGAHQSIQNPVTSKIVSRLSELAVMSRKQSSSAPAAS